MAPVERILEIMRNMLVEFDVFFVLDLRTFARPQGRCLVDRFFLDDCLAFIRIGFDLLVHHHRKTDVIGIFSNNRAQFIVIEVFVFAFAQLQGDLGAACRFINRSNTVFTLALGYPLDTLVGSLASPARTQSDFLGNDKR